MKNVVRNQSKNVTATLGNLFMTLTRIEGKIDRLNLKMNLEKDYLTTQEACVFLGCTRSMIWKLVNAGMINRLKMENGRTYYATHELKNYIERGNPIETTNNQEG